MALASRFPILIGCGFVFKFPTNLSAINIFHSARAVVHHVPYFIIIRVHHLVSVHSSTAPTSSRCQRSHHRSGGRVMRKVDHVERRALGAVILGPALAGCLSGWSLQLLCGSAVTNE